MHDAAASQPAILIERVGSLGRIRLNRPKALNSLTLEMIRVMAQALEDFATDPQVAAVLVTGEGERGLCAGGDIRLLYESGRGDRQQGATFWREEYILNAAINSYAKPYLAIMDGITMGGGVGISAHGRHRIVTERTRLAMPETGIGFFPDVGGTWLLAHSPGEIGTYLGLTGAQIGGADAIHAGLADTLVSTDALLALIDSLSALPPGASDCDVTQKIAAYAAPAVVAPLAENQAEINHVFAHDDIESIIAALRGSSTAFAAKTCETLLAKSPTSLKVTLRLLHLGRDSASLQDCLNREFAVATAIFVDHDFQEGVRAAVIDKDRNPHWSPSGLADVNDSKIDAYFNATSEPVFPV